MESMTPRRNRRQPQNLTEGATTMEILDGGMAGLAPPDPSVLLIWLSVAKHANAVLETCVRIERSESM